LIDRLTPNPSLEERGGITKNSKKDLEKNAKKGIKRKA